MKTRTEWDFELWREPNMLADLNYAIRGHVIQEALKVEDENRRKHLDLHLLARLRLERLARARWTKLHRLQVRDPCECVFYSMHRIMLLDSFNVSHQDVWQNGEYRPGCRVGVIANLQC
jgi:hypothetical protein